MSDAVYESRLVGEGTMVVEESVEEAMLDSGADSVSAADLGG
jgi:hypothetical protein